MLIARMLWAAPNTALGLVLIPLALAGGRVRWVDGALEASGPLLSRLLRGPFPCVGAVAAITLGHVVAGCDQRALERFRSHERVHVRQCERWGPAFIPAYLAASALAWLRGGDPYRDNAFERQAIADGS